VYGIRPWEIDELTAKELDAIAKDIQQMKKER
jgi:hypothetical protein